MFKFTNPELEKFIYSVFDKQDVLRAMTQQLDDKSPIFLFDTDVNSKYFIKPKFPAINGAFYIRKDEVIQTRWTLYPEFEPPQTGKYLVIVAVNQDQISFPISLYEWPPKMLKQWDNVIAFKDLSDCSDEFQGYIEEVLSYISKACPLVPVLVKKNNEP